MTKVVDHNVTIEYFTQDETAQTGEYGRIDNTSLTFAPGETEKTINVTIYSTIDSGDYFYLWLEPTTSMGWGVDLGSGTVKGKGTAN